MQASIVFLVRVQCRSKESSRLLSHLLMSFLFIPVNNDSLPYQVLQDIGSLNDLYDCNRFPMLQMSLNIHSL